MKKYIICLILACLYITSCGNEHQKAQHTPKVNTEGLAPDVAKIDMNAVTRMMCQEAADCIKKYSASHDTASKREKLDKAVMRNLDYARNKGINSDRIAAAVKEAARASQKLEGIMPVTLTGVTTADVVGLFACMFANATNPPSGVLFEDTCLYNRWIN